MTNLFGLKFHSFFLAAALLVAGGPAFAEKRVALVIGNADYDDNGAPTPPELSDANGFSRDLAKPINDADDVEASLRSLGFNDIVSVRNADQVEFLSALDRFRQLVVDKGPRAIVFVYFSGHAMQANSVNYLIPVGARLPGNYDYRNASPVNRDQVIGAHTIRLSTILDTLNNPEGGGVNIDYRPVLWGLAGHGRGEERFVASEDVSHHLQTILPACDLIVGTEEELHIAGGSTDTLMALRTVRAHAPAALIVLKRGPMGCLAFAGAIPPRLEDGVQGPGFPVEVFNVLGAGDAFMSGFLRGWLRDLPLAECCRLANACGAFAVSRHGCAPAIPSWTELEGFLEQGSEHHRLREDVLLEQVHWATNREREWPQVLAFAFDHRAQFEELCARLGAGTERVPVFKRLALSAAMMTADGRGDGGILLDGRFGQDALDQATGKGLWIGRPVELPGSRPLRFEGGADLGCTLREWPAEHCVKCLVFYHPDDPQALRTEQERQVLILADACRRTGHDLLLEVIPGKSDTPVDEQTLARSIERFYALGVYPDWWKLPHPGSDVAWTAISAAISAHDPHCRGVLLLGLDAPEHELVAAFAMARRHPVCKGFAVGRTIFGPPAEDWLAGRINDQQAIRAMAAGYRRLIDAWEAAA